MSSSPEAEHPPGPSDLGVPHSDEVDGAQKVLGLGEDDPRKRHEFRCMGSLLVEFLDRVQVLADDPAPTTGVPTGFIDLDRLTSGLQAGDLILLAARSSMGKTALAINIAQNVALKEGLPVVMFSLKLDASQLTARIVGSFGRIDQTNLRTGKLTDEEWPRLIEAIEALRHISLHVDDRPELTLSEMCANVRRLAHQQGKPGLIVVDSLQLMNSSTAPASDNSTNLLNETYRGLKMLAREMQCPVLLLSRFSQSVAGHVNKRPTMDDLQDMGAIAEDADVIMFIYRDDYYNKKSKEPGVAEIIVSKQRSGPTGTVRLAFLQSAIKFENLAGGGLDDGNASIQ